MTLLTRDSLLGDRLEQVALARGAAVAIVDGSDRVSYSELLRRADALARALQQRGIGPRDLVGISLPRSADLVVAIAGVIRAGAAYVPIDVAHPAERRSLILADARPRAVVTDASGAGGIPAGIETLTLPCEAAPATEPLPRPAPSDPAYVIYTSGSTGRPNGVCVTQHNVARLFATTESLFHFGPDDVWTLFHSIAFDFSVWELWGALLYGGTLVVVPSSTARAADAFHALVIEQGVTVLNQTPSAFRAFDAADAAARRPVNRLRHVVFGGEALDPRTLAPWFAAHGDAAPRLVNMYGITETTVHVTFRPMRLEDARGSGRSLIGSPLPDLRIDLLDADGAPVADGEIGEIHVGGEGVSDGYVRRPELTAARFLPDPRGTRPGARRYRSGDLARRVESGDLEYLGRADLQVKVRGYRIELGEIEASLRAAPAVRDAVVTMHDDASTGPRLVAYVVPSDGLGLDASALREDLARRLPQHMVPAAFVRIDRVPRTINDKVDRAALPAPTADDLERTVDGESPRDDLEREVAGMFSEVLGTPVAARGADFFRLGGHSLLAVRVAMLCQERLDVDVSANAVFAHPTVANLADVVRRERALGRTARRVDRAQREGGAPLTPQQYSLWLELKLRAHTDTYNEPLAFRVSGRIDPVRLRGALTTLAKAHEILRARLVEIEGEPRLLFDRDAAAVELRVLEAGSALEAAAFRPFDLEAGPLWRVLLRSEADGSSVLAIVAHHLIVDAASQTILLRDLAAAYSEPDAPLRVPAFHFADLAVDENARSIRERDELARFWAENLGGVGFTPALPPPCVPCAPEAESEGCTARLQLGSATVHRLRELASSWGTTPFHLYLAAYLAVLRTYTASDDLVVGSPVSLRDTAATNGLVGYLLSPAALRVRMDGAHSFRELVEEVGRRWRAVRAHARLPLHMVLQAARGAQRAGVGSPVQMFFSLIEDALDGLRFDGREVTPVPIAPAHVKFDLFLLVEERVDGAALTLAFPRGILDPAMGERWLRHFEALLRAAAADPGKRVAALPLAGPAENEQIVAWGTNVRPYPRNRSIVDLFEAVARERPDAKAVSAGRVRISYEALERRANAVALALRAAGVKPGDRVPLLVGRGIRFVACAIGVLKCGAAYVPLDPAYPTERLRRMLEGTGASIGLHTQALAAPEGDVTWLDANVADEESDAAPPRASIDPESPAYVMFTSGSTGRPKGVEVPHRAVVRLVTGQDFARMGAGETWLQMAPTSFDASTLEIWAPLLNGGCCVVLEAAMPTPVLLAETIRRGKVTSAWITASLFNALVDEAPACLTGLSQILVGGEALSPAHVRRALLECPGATLVNGYGPTENTTFTCCHVIRREDVEPERSIPIGRPIANTSVRVLDADGKLAPIGVPGELVAGGDGVALGYVGQPEQTAERFSIDTSSSEPGARLYRTGDRVRWRPDGVLEFLARFDDQVKIRGHRVEPGEIAACLAEHETVLQAVVLLKPSAAGAPQLVAYVVPRGNAAELDWTRALLRHASERLPPYMVPASFVLLGELPLDPTGKLDVAALKGATTDHGVGRRDAQHSPMEARILAVWREVLGEASLGLDEDFFEAGGDSLLAVRMLSRLEREFGRGIPARFVTEASTVRRLASILEKPAGARSAYPAGVVEMRKGDPGRPLFCLPGMGSVAFRLRALARKLRTRRAVLAVELHDLEIAPSVLESLSDTAEAVVHCMREIQPEGPYAFLGYSYGGNLAVEVARRLISDGEKVELVAILDAYAPGSLRDPGPLTKLARHVRILVRMKRHDVYEYISTRLVRRLRGQEGDPSDPELPLSSPASEIERQLAETSARCSRAFSSYRPAPFPGRIVLVNATDLGDWMEIADPTGTCGWGAICTQGVKIIPIGCRHLDLFKEPHLTDLAHHVDRLLDGIEGIPPRD